ncbi:hypothetical protein MMC10_003998 [Thelotrema lepadinum]|nr:hypothetical protein [Thelotrema lepadinum]
MAIFISILVTSLALLTTSSCANLTLVPPPNPPSSASPIPHSFPGFAINAVWLPEFAGSNSTPGLFSRNLLQTIANRTGVQAHMRCGGTAFDHTVYNHTLDKAVETLPSSIRNGVEYYVGQPYFDSFANWPNLQWTYQVPLGFGSLENAITLAKKGLSAIGVDNLYALEVGNEPKSATFGTQQKYVDEWLEYSKAIAGNVSGLPNEPLFQGLSLGSSVDPSWNVSIFFEDGINSLSNIKTVSHHFYEVFIPEIQDSSTYLQETLLNHSYLVAKTNYLKDAVSFLNANTQGPIPLILGEIDSGYPKGNTNATQHHQILRSLATAIWTVDFHLYMMSIGVKGLSNQLGLQWDFSPWTANVTANEGTVHPTYYGIVFAADALGSNASLPTTIRQLNTTSENTKMTAYALYHGTRLSKVAIVNLDFWDGTGQRPEMEIGIGGLPSGVERAKVKKLTADGGSLDLEGVRWGGESWSWESGGMPVKVGDVNGTESVQVDVGKVKLKVGATEAVLVSF